MFEYYYNKNLRKLVVGFGTLFSNIYVSHVDPAGGSKTLEVPVTYASQEKFIQRLLNPSSITDGTRIETQLPRMSFHLTNIASDPSRRRTRRLPQTSPGSGANCTTNNVIGNEIPVNVGFNLFVYTRHIDDMLQIVEQIMPFFVPEHVITIKLNDGIDDLNIPIVMVSNNLTDRYEGDLNTRRLHIASFTFLAKSYIFGKAETTNTVVTSTNDIQLD